MHFKEVCKVHGNVLSQCRCPGTYNRLTKQYEKKTYKMECPLNCKGRWEETNVGYGNENPNG